MLDIIRKMIKGIFLVLILWGCNNQSQRIKLEIKSGNSSKIEINRFDFYKTDLGAIYVHILNENKNLLIQKDSLINATLLLDNNTYPIKIIKQFFDRTIIKDEFFFTVDNKSGKLIADEIGNKSLFLIGFEKNVRQILDQEKVKLKQIK